MTSKEKKFCEEYLVDLDGTKAAIRAGYSKRTAGQIAYDMMQKQHIKKYLEKKRTELEIKTGVKAESVIRELAALGFYNVQDLVNDENCAIKISKAEREILKPVVGLKVTETITKAGERIIVTDLKLANKIEALVSLGKHLGVFEKDNNQKSAVIKVTRK